MNLPRYARVLLAIGSGVALGLAFPNYNLYLLAWVAMGMLVLACCGAPLKEAPLYGFLHGQVFYPVCLPWVDTVMRQYGNIDPWIAGAFVGLIGFVGGLICMAFSTAWRWPRRKADCWPACWRHFYGLRWNFSARIFRLSGRRGICRGIPRRAAWRCCRLHR